MPFGIYVHVPFCASRCGYCDFNTYTAAELGGGGDQAAYADNAIAELDLACTQPDLACTQVDSREIVSTVFFGGGTPTLLPAADLARIIAAIRARFDVASDAEITTEANPESVDRRKLDELRAAGFTRISFGMQSARAHVLAVLDRQHRPRGALDAVAAARAAGFEHVNVDLIYGTPGESDADWQASLDAAVDIGVDHVSAYSLIVEDGTKLAARIRRGELPMPDDDVAADRYLMAEATLTGAGYGWYEVSNWARSVGAQSRHNRLYWTGGDWWGVGPGAHSHVGGVRWWNVKHPSTYAARLADGGSPEDGREVLDAETRHVEDVMLRLRLKEGLALASLSAPAQRTAGRLVVDGLLDEGAHGAGRAALTLTGRLLADAVVRQLVD
jgi:oxygen-independent coproporphyrinogen-3 oxidase